MQTEGAVTPGKNLGGGAIQPHSELAAALGCCMNPCVYLFVCASVCARVCACVCGCVCVFVGGCFICLPVSLRLTDGKRAMLDEKKEKPLTASGFLFIARFREEKIQ